MEVLEKTIKKQHISLNFSSKTTYHGHALCTSSLSYSASYSSTSNEWVINSGAYYDKAKDQAIFYTMHECNTKQIFLVKIDLKCCRI